MRKFVLAAVIVIMAVFAIPVGASFFGYVGVASASGVCTGAPGPKGSAPANASLFQAIAVDTKGNPELELAMLETSNLESGWQNTASGGGAFGPFQIQDPGSNINPNVTIAEAENPAWATNYMYPRYKAAINNVDPSLWNTNPELAAEETGYNAEHPKLTYYQQQGTAAVNAAYHAAVNVMQSQGLKGKLTNVKSSLAAQVANCQAPAISATGARYNLLKAAFTQIGVPYVWGGTTPQLNGHPGQFDCSGFVQWTFQQIRINLPRTSEQQWTYTNSHTVTTSMSGIGKALPGDLVFFAGSDGTLTSPGHIGIYVGKGEIIDAPQSGETVHVEPINAAWGFVGITDPFFLLKGQHG